MPTGVGNLARPELLIVVFSLMADSQNGNRLSILDFEQCHVACRAKWDDDFTEKRIGILSLATGERKFLKEGPRAIDNVHARSAASKSCSTKKAYKLSRSAFASRVKRTRKLTLCASKRRGFRATNP